MHISNFSNLHVVCIMSYFYKIFFLTYLLCKLKGGPSVAKGDCLKCFISAVGCPPRTICSAIDSPGGPFLWGTSYSMTRHTDSAQNGCYTNSIELYARRSRYV